MAGVFKAYDVRGIYPDTVDEALAERIGGAFATLLDEHGGRGPVAVSRDMRPHSVPLLAALVEGLRAGGRDVIDVGLATTPMSYFAVGHLGAAGGVQVTASHNPARYNGFKFSLEQARPVSGDDGIPRIEQLATGSEAPNRSSRPGSLESRPIFDAYAEHLLGPACGIDVAAIADARLRVAVDAANGMGALYAPLLQRVGIELLPLYFELDGTFPNHEANPLKLENLRDVRAAVTESSAHLGVAFDGDADRAAFVDEQARPIGSDLATALIGGAKLQRGRASGKRGSKAVERENRARERGSRAVVYDVRSSRAVPEYIRECGGEPVQERVGHSFIKATLRRLDGVFGGELAGHYYFPETYFADSSMLAVLEVLQLLARHGKPTSALVAPLRRYAKSEEINFEVEDKDGAMRDLVERYATGRLDRIDGIRIDFPDWWFNVRPSNTEPLLRLVLEARTPELLEEKQGELVALLGEPV
jgi:phosphomannomutase